MTLTTREEWAEWLRHYKLVKHNLDVIEAFVAGKEVVFGIGDKPNEELAFTGDRNSYSIVETEPKKRPFRVGELHAGTRLYHKGWPTGMEIVITKVGSLVVSTWDGDFSYEVLADDWLYFSDTNEKRGWFPCFVEEKL